MSLGFNTPLSPLIPVQVAVIKVYWDGLLWCWIINLLFLRGVFAIELANISLELLLLLPLLLLVFSVGIIATTYSRFSLLELLLAVEEMG